MNNRLYIVLAPIQLKDGIDEKTLLEASEAFQTSFASRQQGIQKRMLMRGKYGGYADLVFFESKEAAERVTEAEAKSPECLEFFQIMKAPDENLPDMGVLSFELMETYE